MTLIDEILDGLRLRSTVFSRMTLAGQWGFAKDELTGAPFHLLLSGTAWLRLEDGHDAERLDAGDIAILPQGQRHHLLANAGVSPVPWRQIVDHMGWTHWTPGMRFKSIDLQYGSGEPTTVLISGVFAFGDHRRNPLLSALPALLLVRRDSDTPAARAVEAVTSLLETELLSGRPGAESVAARLADILFIQVVRSHLAQTDTLPPGWLRGLADRELAPVIARMHSAPNQTWSVATLAHEGGMSRSRFAARFQEVVGQGPLEYLTEWRMYQAAGFLAEGQSTLGAIAASVGYRSDVAFNKAFKRWAGRSAADYRKSLRLAAPHDTFVENEDHEK